MGSKISRWITWTSHKKLSKEICCIKWDWWNLGGLFSWNCKLKCSKWNDKVKYLLTVIDVFSKYGWIKPLKDKKTESVSKAFVEIFKTSKRKPKMIWSDKDSEFISNHFKEFLRVKVSSYVTLRKKGNQVLVRDGIRQWKIGCG